MLQLYQYHVMTDSKLDSRCLLLAWLYNLQEFHGKAEASGGAALFLSQKLETFNPAEQINRHANLHASFARKIKNDGLSAL